MRRFTEPELKEIVRLYLEEKWSCYKIAKRVGRLQPTIREKLISLGVPQRTLRQAIPKHYEYDRNFFCTVDSEEKAYWLGFIAADGSICGNDSIYIGLAEEDKSHIEKWLKAINLDKPVKVRKSHGFENSQLCAYAAVNSIQLVEGLIKHGIGKRKTYGSFWPRVSKELLRHFLRGYVDGDGCWTSSDSSRNGNRQAVFGLIGNREFLNKFMSVLIEECALNTVKIRKTKSRFVDSFYYTGNTQVLRIARYLYKDATVYLDRKLSKIMTHFGEEALQ